MGFQLIVNISLKLRSQRGSVTAESALALAGIALVLLVCLQSLSVIVLFLQMQNATYEASQIASAFGSLQEQQQDAQKFLSTYLPNAATSVQINDTTAVANASQRIEVLSFGFTIDVKSVSSRWDAL